MKTPPHLHPFSAAARAKARGASSNATGRFESTQREVFDDGWPLGEDEALPVLKTEIREERPRSVINKVNSPDLGFSRTLNPYRGCEHGCIYCFARPTHSYLGFSAGLDFETKLIARPEAPEVLRKELSRKGYVPEVLAIGTNTDPYQPIERDLRVMRGVLEVLQAFNHPVGITTKGTLVERDIDILAPMAALNLARVGVSITTLDADLCRRLEPRAPSPKRRLQVIRRLSEAGISVRVMVAPVIPALTDHELEPILEAAKEAGARAAGMITLRLPLEVSPLFREWLEVHAPDRAARVMGRVQDMQGGKDYNPTFGQRFKGQGVWADLMRQRFALALKRTGLLRELPPMRCDLFAHPQPLQGQLSLF